MVIVLDVAAVVQEILCSGWCQKFRRFALIPIYLVVVVKETYSTTIVYWDPRQSEQHFGNFGST